MAEAINQFAPKESKSALARRLGISRASLYYRPKLPAKDLKLKADIEMVMGQDKAYGHRRIADELDINKKRALRVMKLYGLKPKRRRKKPEKPKDKNQKPATTPNLVKGLAVSCPHRVWASDFTYLPYFGKFVYLATVEDIFTRQLVGWAVSTRHNVNLVTLALVDAVLSHPIPDIIHSDQGSEYRHKIYRNLLKSLNIKQSMTARKSPWENGYQESFYSGFKFELGHPEIYPELGELIEAVAQQIHYYNNHRIHTALKCPPAVFARRYDYKNNPPDRQVTAVRQVV